MPNSGLTHCAVAGLDGTTTFNADIALAVKRDGTWVQVGTAQAGSNWSRNGSEIVYGQELTISNNSGLDQEFTDGAIIASQDLGQTIVLLNTDENAVTNLIGGITPIQGSPVTLQNGQTLRFTQLRVDLV